MTDVGEMVDSTGGNPSGELVAAITALRDCEQVSNACAMAMVEAGGMVLEVRRALDCADICEAAERVLLRSQSPDPVVTAAVVEAAAVACEASSTACGAHADHHPHCRLHSVSARRCADALRALHKAS